jgi:hypothetical protein
MRSRQPITLDTSHGPNTAVAEPITVPTVGEAWSMTTPWGGFRFVGTPAQARHELARAVRESEDADG